MIDLDRLFANSPTVELIEPRGASTRYLRSLRLLLHDLTTGALTELTIEADSLVLPDGPILVLSVMDVDEPRVTATEHGEFVDDGLSVIIDDVEPDATWRVDMHGVESDLRAVADGLF